MKTSLSRRDLIRGMVASALIPALSRAEETKPWWLGNGMPQESQNTPKIACQIDLRNGITDQKMRAIVQTGEDPVSVCRYFGSRDRINHVHYRNPHVMKPYVKYDEGFIDEGDVNMLAVMRELLKVKYTREIYPEHPRALDYDRARGPIHGYPGGGGYAGDLYDIAYAKAMLQAALLMGKS
jgi:D-mannonate dehydratase